MNASQIETRPFLSMSAPGSVSALMKYSGNTVSKRCAGESVAVMTMRRGPASRSRNGKLARRRIDDDKAAGKRFQQRGPLGAGEIGTDEVELGFQAVECAVPDHEHQEQIVGSELCAQALNRAPHARSGCRVLPIGSVEQHLDVPLVES